MYDALRASYRFHCPHREAGRSVVVALSAFRRLERLPGVAHPAVYQVLYRCGCGDDHTALVGHDDLDSLPTGADGEPVAFVNLMTGRRESLADELVEIARGHLARGNWPWRFYCTLEAKVRPAYPSCLSLVAPAGRGNGELVGVAVRCPGCGAVSVNLVSAAHLDVPFYHDPVVRFLERPFGDGRDLTLDHFHDQLHSARFDAERADLG